MDTILQSILPIFILIGVGVVLQYSLPKRSRATILMCKIGLGSCETMTSVLNRFALYLALPALIIHSLATTSKESVGHLDVYVLTVLALLLVIALAYAITRKLRVERSLANAYIFGAFFGNVAYIGFPFIDQLLPGNDGVISILIALHVVVAFTVGIYILEHSKKGGHRSVGVALLKNPLLLSVLVGLGILLFEIPLPEILVTPLSMLAASASPVVLIAVGTFIASNWHFDHTLFHSFAIAGIKLVLAPLVFLFFAVFMTPSTALDISLLEAAMPVALTNFALAEVYPIHKKIMAKAIILSTLFSLVTLAFWSAAIL